MELRTETPTTIGGMPAEIFELARAAGLSVCTAAQSTFNRQVANFAVAIQAQMLADIDRLRIEVAELRQVRDDLQPPPVGGNCSPEELVRRARISEARAVRMLNAESDRLHDLTESLKTPALQPGEIEFIWAGFGVAVACHLTYEPEERGLREVGGGAQLSPDYPATAVLNSAWLRGANIFSLLEEAGKVAEIEKLALIGVMS